MSRRGRRFVDLVGHKINEASGTVPSRRYEQCWGR